MTGIEPWEDHLVPNGRSPSSEQALADSKIPGDDDADPPAYEDVVPASVNLNVAAVARSRAPTGPRRLQILAATWGGVIVTPEIQSLVKLSSSSSSKGGFETLSLNMHTIHTLLIPDPALALVKSLCILYRYHPNGPVAAADSGIHLLNAPQFAPQISIEITPDSHVAETSRGSSSKWYHCAQRPTCFSPNVGAAPWRDSRGKVEILAAVYGMERVEAPSALEELARLFRGERGQIRTTAKFFKADAVQPWAGVKKTWTVFFRLLERGDGKAVRCVTGWEEGALEVPWDF